MLQLSALERRFCCRGEMRGGILFLRAPVAVDLIEAARAEGVPIVGIDSFVLRAGYTQPQMEHILDLSGAGPNLDSWHVAASFIKTRAELDLYFEVVLDE